MSEIGKKCMISIQFSKYIENRAELRGQALQTQVSKLSHNPEEILAKVLALSGAIRNISAQSLN